MNSVPAPALTGLARWWVYQRERFPLFGHGPLILAFSFSAVSFSWLLRSESGWPAWRGGRVWLLFDVLPPAPHSG